MSSLSLAMTKIIVGQPKASHAPSFPLRACGAARPRPVASARPHAPGRRLRCSRPGNPHTTGRRRHSPGSDHRNKIDSASFNTLRVPEGVIDQRLAPAFSSSHALIWSSRGPSPSGGTPIRTRTGKRRSASAIMNLDLAGIGMFRLCSWTNFPHIARGVELDLRQGGKLEKRV